MNILEEYKEIVIVQLSNEIYEISKSFSAFDFLFILKKDFIYDYLGFTADPNFDRDPKYFEYRAFLKYARITLTDALLICSSQLHHFDQILFFQKLSQAFEIVRKTPRSVDWYYNTGFTGIVDPNINMCIDIISKALSKCDDMHKTRFRNTFTFEEW